MPNIKKIRKSQNLNAMELAQKAGLDLNQPLMSAMESGKMLPTPHDLQAVCEALQCTPMDLFDSVDEFDLMAVQFAMDNGFDVVNGKPETFRKIPGRDIAFEMLPEGNPKRSAGRWSDTDWNDMQYALQLRGFKHVKQYLAMNLLGVSNLKKRA